MEVSLNQDNCEGYQESIQLSGAYMTKTNKLNKPEKGAWQLWSRLRHRLRL
jgi:hypothetical protein